MATFGLKPYSVRQFTLLTWVAIITLTTVQAQEHRPFRVVWNYPDDPCINQGYEADLAKWGIERNANKQFKGDTVSTLYTGSAGNNGRWPIMINETYGVYGGIPQRVNYTDHYLKMAEDIFPVISENATGFCVMDFEAWRPEYYLNWGGKTKYKTESIEHARSQFPSYTEAQLLEVAIEQFNYAAEELFTETMEYLISNRPNCHWGYYIYPESWGPGAGGKTVNDEKLPWLHGIVTGFYPSIYLHKVLTYTNQEKEDFIIDIIEESLRCKYYYGKNDTDTLTAAYAFVERNLYYFNETDLYYAIGLPAEMGVDAVIVWGSSSFLHNGRCVDLQQYVEDVFGPYVNATLEKAKNCSETQCSDNGRCVRADLAELYPHIALAQSTRHKRSAEPEPEPEPQSSSSSMQQFFSMFSYSESSSTGNDATQSLVSAPAGPEYSLASSSSYTYVCQCYYGYEGTNCENEV